MPPANQETCSDHDLHPAADWTVFVTWLGREQITVNRKFCGVPSGGSTCREIIASIESRQMATQFYVLNSEVRRV